MVKKVRKTDAEWRAQLSPQEYTVLRQQGTERPFTGRYWDTTEPGIYRCLGCGTPFSRRIPSLMPVAAGPAISHR